MFRFHVVGSQRSLSSPASRYSAYMPRAARRSRPSPSGLTPRTWRNVSQSRRQLALFCQVRVAGAPFSGSSRSQRLTNTVGRGTPGASSSLRSSSMSTGIRSRMSGCRATSQDSQPVAEKPISCMARSLDIRHGLSATDLEASLQGVPQGKRHDD